MSDTSRGPARLLREAGRLREAGDSVTITASLFVQTTRRHRRARQQLVAMAEGHGLAVVAHHGRGIVHRELEVEATGTGTDVAAWLEETASLAG